MTAAQRYACFNLIVLAATLGVVAALYPVLGFPRAMGGVGILGLCGFGALFFRRRGRVAFDERDTWIHRQSTAWAYGTFWIAFVAAALLASHFYACVPIEVVQASVWAGFMMILGVQSIVTLVLYRTGAADGR